MLRGMSRISLLLTIVLVGVYLAGCGFASPAASTQRGQDVPTARKTLSLGMVAEPGNLATNALSGGTKNRADDLRAAIQHSLAANNDRDEVVPQLAVEVTGARLTRVYSSSCPTEQSRWAGANRGCYQNPEMDRVVDGLLGAMDLGEQRPSLRDLVSMQTEDLPLLPITFGVSTLLFREGISSTTFEMHNLHEWDVR